MEHLQREAWANPSSLHGPGLVAAEALTRFRLQIAACLGAEPEQLIFTSGATESNNIAIKGVARFASHTVATALRFDGLNPKLLHQVLQGKEASRHHDADGA